MIESNNILPSNAACCEGRQVMRLRYTSSTRLPDTRLMYICLFSIYSNYILSQAKTNLTIYLHTYEDMYIFSLDLDSLATNIKCNAEDIGGTKSDPIGGPSYRGS
jgi:hypothetical protein